MAHVMAIVGKTVFEGLEREHGALAPGATVPLDRYLSAHKGLRTLAEGGSLHLVTARPGDALWLVGVLRAPRFGRLIP